MGLNGPGCMTRNIEIEEIDSVKTYSQLVNINEHIL